jgi:hypothetical protein
MEHRQLRLAATANDRHHAIADREALGAWSTGGYFAGQL